MEDGNANAQMLSETIAFYFYFLFVINLQHCCTSVKLLILDRLYELSLGTSLFEAAVKDGSDTNAM